ncbi:MAG: photosynthetic complex putative assembly protein PuhB [Halieaceae bacterium]|nr:photosynthetic complex putative assembly protein PuhB [Halieaceae bacterium]
MSVAEHEHEPVRGLPDYLPDGEELVWRGEPSFRVMALRVFHMRAVAVYLTLLLCAHFSVQMYNGASLSEVLAGSSWMLALGVLALAILALLAWAYTRSTVYTVTNKRVVLRFGVAIPMMVNLPLTIVGSADLRRYADGSGDITLTLSQKKKLSYTLLWPNIKPWQFKPVVPSMRCLPDVDAAAAAVAEAVGRLDDSHSISVERSRDIDAAEEPMGDTGHWVGAS